MAMDEPSNGNGAANPPQARFRFASPGFTVEFRGAEAYVREQLELVRGRIREILAGGVEAAPAAAAGADESAPKESGAASPLEEFYQRSRTREGRGALQDSILLFAWYVLEHQKKLEFTIEDLNFCFDLLGIPRPKSLANTLGILKRDRGWLASSGRRGAYTLTARGRDRLKSIVD